MRLSEIRRELKREIEASQIVGRKVFEVWINEESPPKGGSWDSWDVCMEAVADCDVLLALSNGNAGWAKGPGDIGICHAELMTGLSASPGKVFLVDLGTVVSSKPDQKSRDERFQQYLRDQSLFRGGTVKTVEDLKVRVRGALAEAVVSLAQRGVREASKGKFHSGEALDWTRLDFAGRQAQIAGVLAKSLKARAGARDVGTGVSVEIGGKQVLISPRAIPAAMSVASAREMVGQPFLKDFEAHEVLESEAMVGPVHLIGCHKSVSEPQALRILGFPDATVVAAPFGVYVADDIQKIQMIFIGNCRDESSTRHGVQRMFEWLLQTGEGDRLAARAASRARIVEVIHIERAVAKGLPRAKKRSIEKTSRRR
jgi:hypothetical protein